MDKVLARKACGSTDFNDLSGGVCIEADAWGYHNQRIGGGRKNSTGHLCRNDAVRDETTTCPNGREQQ
jgi:hypothetical protein